MVAALAGRGADLDANRIPQAQTHRFHYMWYNTQHTLQDWVDASWEHQRWVIKFTTEAFRRDNRMVSFAIHLFIDAFPSGWMKTIMDVDRQPKPAYFAYREALTPLMTSLRTDRWNYFAGEPIAVEAWVSNDTDRVPEGYTLSYQLERGNRVIFAHRIRLRCRFVRLPIKGRLRSRPRRCRNGRPIVCGCRSTMRKASPCNRT